MRDPYITVRAVQPLAAALQALGFDSRSLLAESGIAATALAEVDGRVPQSAVMALWQRAATATQDPWLGLHLAEAAPIDSFEMHGYALLGSPSLRAAYRRACRYQRLIHETTLLEFEEGPAQSVLRHCLPDGRAVSRQPAEFLVASWIRFGRLIAGETWSPVLASFAHSEPEDLAEHRRILRCPLRFNTGGTALLLASDTLDAANMRADPALVSLLDRYADTLLERAPARGTLGGKVRAWLLGQLVVGELSTTAAAKALHLSVRSLHRGLREEDTSFRALLDRLRRERAISLLDNPGCSIGEVAFLLGFAELSPFYRAFKRWTGTTPAEYRAGTCAADIGVTGSGAP